MGKLHCYLQARGGEGFSYAKVRVRTLYNGLRGAMLSDTGEELHPDARKWLRMAANNISVLFAADVTLHGIVVDEFGREIVSEQVWPLAD